MVIDGGKIHKRAKKASKVHREAYGHTPLSPRGKPALGRPATDRRHRDGRGRLPVMPEVHQEAARRKVELVIVPTEEACRLLADRRTRMCTPCCTLPVERSRPPAGFSAHPQSRGT
ncbi:MAG: hypothetical protein U1F59_02475 [Candidatus Competibacteraceae bacterium]